MTNYVNLSSETSNKKREDSSRKMTMFKDTMRVTHLILRSELLRKTVRHLEKIGSGNKNYKEDALGV